MKISLIIMAGGQGKRFGGEIKALASVGPNGETIMDYSLHDAIKAGFNQIIIVINKDIESKFIDDFGNHAHDICEKYNVDYHYVLERVEDVPPGSTYPKERLHPWGTGQAVLACKEYLAGPFAVINADDFYGFSALNNMYMHLCQNTSGQYFMTGYNIIKTLPPSGAVNRGICSVTDDIITDICETGDILLKTDSSEKSHCIYAGTKVIPENSIVNMNLWGFPIDFLEILENEYANFFIEMESSLMNAEFLLPVIMGKLVRKKQLELRLLKSVEECFGLTHHTDMHIVSEKINALVEAGLYKSFLYEDMNDA